MDEVPKFSLRNLEVLVLDEADRLFEGNLAAVVKDLVKRMHVEQGINQPRSKRQTVLLSATMPTALKDFASTGLSEGHAVVRLDAERYLSPTLWSAFYIVSRANKMASLLFLLREVVQGGAGPAWSKGDSSHGDAKESQASPLPLVQLP
jgi:superfamily II DNA/RNA helicase